MTELLPCPFCGEQPQIFPTDPEKDGDAWGRVKCCNSNCNARPHVDDGEDISDERGSMAYKKMAMVRWNTRFESPELAALRAENHALKAEIQEQCRIIKLGISAMEMLETRLNEMLAQGEKG